MEKWHYFISDIDQDPTWLSQATYMVSVKSYRMSARQGRIYRKEDLCCLKKPSRNRNDVGTQLWKSLLCRSNKMPKHKCSVNKEVYLNHESGSWNVHMASCQLSWKGPLAASQGITMCLRSQNRARHVQKEPNTQGGLGLKQPIFVGSNPVLSNLTVSVPSKVASSVT